MSTRLLITLLISCALSFAIGCGGSGSSSAPAPTFTSSAPVAAHEGETYTYTLSASDPQGGAVTFSLASSPSGATLSGSTITWTPTHAQARQSNAFAVLATTPAKATATQSFSVTPAGDIHGSRINTYWDANGNSSVPTSVPFDLSALTSIAALVPDASGNLATIAGHGSADGTFVIPNVPAGFYWLQILPNQMFWTNSSDFDDGADFADRYSQSTPATNIQFTANLNISGLSPWTADSTLVGITPSVLAKTLIVRNFSTPQPPLFTDGTTAFTGPLPAAVSRDIDASQGDRTYLLQLQPAPPIGDAPSALMPSFFSSQHTVSALGPLPLSATSSTTALDIAGAFTSAASASMRAKIAAAGFTQSVGSLQPFGFGASVAYVPTADRYMGDSLQSILIGLPLASVAAPSTLSSDVDAGDVPYVNPFPSTWVPVYSANQMAANILLVGTTRIGLILQTGYSTTTAPTADKPFQLPMSNVQNPLINGVSLFSASSAATPATLTWTPPTGLSPAEYLVYVTEVAQNPCPPFSSTSTPCLVPQIQLAGEFTTTSTTLNIPPGILQPGHQYLFQIVAIADGKMNPLTAPFRRSWNQAISNVCSNLITIADPGSALQQPPLQHLVEPSQSIDLYMVGPEGVHQVARVASR